MTADNTVLQQENSGIPYRVNTLWELAARNVTQADNAIGDL